MSMKPSFYRRAYLCATVSGMPLSVLFSVSSVVTSGGIFQRRSLSKVIKNPNGPQAASLRTALATLVISAQFIRFIEKYIIEEIWRWPFIHISLCIVVFVCLR